ncbi:MAG: 50S ribosomal protein L11 methyltransferase [Deltaproteobacteria bacterium]|nr:50S ribosomal protein L11 methyltransferase [Deltaproteobacteria bacterium]
MMPKERQVLVKSFLSFGSGFHPTTRLCARLMERMFSGRMKDILDVGTGSGILALCAWRLGARRVLAVDRISRPMAHQGVSWLCTALPIVQDQRGLILSLPTSP